MKLLNALGFNTIWVISVFYGNEMILVPIFLLIVHLFFIKNMQYELITIGVITLFGVGIDSVLTLIGVYSFDATSASFLGLPLWLIVLWFGFSSTINHSFSFVTKSFLFQILIGIALLPLNYFYGYKLNAVNFNYSVINTLMILSFVWGTAVPLMFYCLRITHEKLNSKSTNNEQ